MANVQKRTGLNGKVTYRLRVFVGYDALGKQIFKTKTWIPDDNLTAKQAEKEAAKQAILFEEECQNDILTVKKVRFKDLAEEWFQLMEITQKMKMSTIVRYRTCTDRTYKAFGNVYIDKITFRDVQMFILGLSHKGVNQRTGGGLSQKSQKHHLSFISDVMQYAIQCGLIKTNPCTNVSTVKTDSPEKLIYSLEEMRMILRRIDQFAPTEYKIFFYLAAFCGLRKGEILGIEFKDIDLDRGTLSIERTSNYHGSYTGVYTSTPKTKKSKRILILPPEILQLIPILKDEQQNMMIICGDQWHETDRLMIGWNGRPMHPNTPYNWLERFCDAEKLPFKGIHSFRHAFATEAIIEGGVNFCTVSSILGHSTPTTTLNTYAHAIQIANAKALNTVADLVNLGVS